MHLFSKDGTVATPFGLLHLGGFGLFAVADVGGPDPLAAGGLEATVLEDLAIDDTAAMFMPTIGTDYFYLVVKMNVQLNQEVAFALAAVEFL